MWQSEDKSSQLTSENLETSSPAGGTNSGVTGSQQSSSSQRPHKKHETSTLDFVAKQTAQDTQEFREMNALDTMLAMRRNHRAERRLEAQATEQMGNSIRFDQAYGRQIMGDKEANQDLDTQSEEEEDMNFPSDEIKWHCTENHFHEPTQTQPQQPPPLPPLQQPAPAKQTSPWLPVLLVNGLAAAGIGAGALGYFLGKGNDNPPAENTNTEVYSGFDFQGVEKPTK